LAQVFHAVVTGHCAGPIVIFQSIVEEFNVFALAADLDEIFGQGVALSVKGMTSGGYSVMANMRLKRCRRLRRIDRACAEYFVRSLIFSTVVARLRRPSAEAAGGNGWRKSCADFMGQDRIEDPLWRALDGIRNEYFAVIENEGSGPACPQVRPTLTVMGQGCDQLGMGCPSHSMAKSWRYCSAAWRFGRPDWDPKFRR